MAHQLYGEEMAEYSRPDDSASIRPDEEETAFKSGQEQAIVTLHQFRIEDSENNTTRKRKILNSIRELHMAVFFWPSLVQLQPNGSTSTRMRC